MDGAEDLDVKLARLGVALRERERLGPRRAAIAAEITRVSGELAALRRDEAAEQRDVDRVRALATWRLARESRLERERAEADEARSRVAEAESRLASLRAQLKDVTGRLETTSTAPATYAAAVKEKERRLREAGHRAGGRLAELGEEREALRGELERLQRAATAAGKATESLRQANELLDAAGSWSAADTFLGGGVITSYGKHRRVDEAAGHVTEAERHLAVLRKVLGDRRLTGPVAAGLGSDATTRFVDVWFDNIFTDLSVGRRIDAGQAQVGRAAARVGEARSAITTRIADVRARLRGVEAERELLLRPAPVDAGIDDR